MLKSFSMLARTLNLSKTVRELDVSRQTVRRHINDLEELRGMKLFDFHDRKYSLTNNGKQALIEAELLLQRSIRWMNGEQRGSNGLTSVNVKLHDETPFVAQRHPLNAVWDHGHPLLQEGLKAWLESRSQLEADEMKLIRPYLIIHRKRNDEWICTEVGEQSSLASWLGWSWAKSAVGTAFKANPVSSASDSLIVEAYDTVMRTGGVWYDHIAMHLKRNTSHSKEPVNYQRIVFVCMFPDGEPAVAALVARTNNVLFSGVSSDEISMMDDSDVMDVDLENLFPQSVTNDNRRTA
jgi:biotin operon repressor